MQIMRRMNKKLDIGWKLTNSNCQQCNGVTMTDPNNLHQYYCPKCDKIRDFNFDTQVSPNAPSSVPHEQEDEDYFNEVIAQSGLFSKPSPMAVLSKQNSSTYSSHNQNYSPITTQKRQQSTNNVSKKLGEKLLQGWTMLQQSCQDCNVPLMKSKKGEKICCSCEKDYAKEQAEQQQKKVSPTTIIQPNANAQQSKSSQKTAVQTKPSPITQPQSTQITKISAPKQGLKNQDLIDSIQCKALRFLELKMDKAIEENDISAVEKILAIVKGLK